VAFAALEAWRGSHGYKVPAGPEPVNIPGGGSLVGRSLWIIIGVPTHRLIPSPPNPGPAKPRIALPACRLPEFRAKDGVFRARVFYQASFRRIQAIPWFLRGAVKPK
jgi:hypothetical protein